MAQTDEQIETPLTSGTTDNPDAPQSSAVAPPPLPQGYSRAGQATTPQEAPPLPKGFSRPGQPEEKGLLDQASESPTTSPDQKVVLGAAKAARGLYHGVMGDEESDISKGKTSTASPVAENLGFTPEHMAHQAGSMAHDVGKFVYGVGKDLNSPMPVVSENEWGSDAKEKGYKGPTFLEKYVLAPSAQEKQEAIDEAQKFHQTQGWEAFGHALNNYIHTAGEFVPMAGPFAAQLIKKAQGGDVGGALAQVAALKAGEKAQHAVTGELKTRASDALESAKETPQVTQAKSNVTALAKELAKKQAAFDTAKAAHDQYAASHAQGVSAPKNVTNAMDKAAQELEEAQFHHDSAAEALTKAKGSQPSIPQQVGSAAGKAVAKVLPKQPAPAEIPTQAIEAAPAPAPLKKLGAPAPPINVKTPGQIQPETIQQTPTAIPRSPLGRIDLANDQGTMGKQPLLGEGTPEGPQVPSAGLPKLKQEVLPPEKPAAKPERGNVKALTVDDKGNVLDKEQTPEGRLQKLLEESLRGNESTKTSVTKEPTNYDKSKDQIGVREKMAYDDAMAKRTEEGGKTRVEGTADRRTEDKPVEDERRQSERRVLKDINERTFQESAFGGDKKENIDTDAYAKAMEQARKELGPDANVKDVVKRRDELVNPEAKGAKGDVGDQARKANPEPTRAETKGTPKDEEDHQPAVQEQVTSLSDENLKQLAKAHNLNPDDYDFKVRDEGRHRTERNLLAQHIVEAMGSDEKSNLGRAAARVANEGPFENAAKTGKSKAERAASLFPRLRGPVDEFGNASVSGGAPDTGTTEQKATGYSQKADKRYPATVGTAEGAKSDTEHFANAKKELGDKASISEIAKRAQEMKDEAKSSGPLDLKKAIAENNKTEGLGEVTDNKLEAPANRKQVAKAFDEMKHDPSNPEVKKSYDSLVGDVKKQWDMLEKSGLKFEPTDEDPYKSYDEMKKDFADNKRMKIFRGGNELPEDHPLAKVDPKTGETYNVMFRGVHDAIGHLLHDNDFSEKGEENAYDTHRQTMSKDAVPAMTTETKGQTAAYFDKGDFPEQKAGIMQKVNDKGAPIDEYGNPTVSGGSQSATKQAKPVPTSEQMLNKYGESDGDPAHTAFILSDGKGVKQWGLEHSQMAGGVDNLPKFVNQEGAIRMRSYGAYGNRQFNLSLPESGITTSQLAELKRMAPQISSGKVYIEAVGSKPVADAGDFREIEHGKASDELESTIRGLVKVKNDKGAPVDEYGNPTVSGGSQSAGTATAKTKPLPKLAEEHLTEEEKAGVTKSDAGRKSFVENLKKLPSVQEFTDIAKAGEGGRKWYQRSAAAFDALTEEAPRYFKDGDRQKFTDFLAALSPQQSVKMNLGEALNAWTRYVDEGRPTGKELSKLLNDELTLPGAKIPNATKALAGEPLWPDLSKNSNFKVPSFAKNLNGYLDHVTNDGWQALFGGLDAKQVSRATSYHPLAVVTRAAADALGWEPAEAQAAIWAFTKVFTEKGETEPADIRRRSEDFADILAMDPEIRQQLEKLGVNHEQLDAKLRAIGKKPPVTPGASPTTENSTRKLRERIEKARGKGVIPAPKSGNLNFEPDEETEFNPEDFTQANSKLEPLGKKKSPLGRIK